MKKQAGFLNILSVAIVIIMGLLTAALVNMVMSSHTASNDTQARNRAYDLAVSAVQAGMYQLTVNTSVCTGANQAIQSLSTGEYQYNCSNYVASSKLSGDITSTSTSSLSVVSSTGFAPVGYVNIDSEVIYYNSISGNTLLGLRRGMQNTTPASHNGSTAPATVSQNEYVVVGMGGSPSIASPMGYYSIAQAATVSGGLLFAGDANGYIYQYNGSSWSLQSTSPVSPAAPIYGISCTASNDCWAVGGAVGEPNKSYAYHYNGSNWTSTQVGTNDIKAISCTSASSCQAVGSDGVYAYGPTCSGVGTCPSACLGTCTVKWSGPTSWPLTGGSNFTGISCPDATDCWAVTQGSPGSVFYYNGSWNVIAVLTASSHRALYDINCPSTTNCQAVGTGPRAYSYQGSPASWSTSRVGTGNNPITNVSCPSTAYCFAVGGNNGAYAYNGTWTTATPAPSTMQSVSCFSSTKCLTGDGSGQFYSFNGSTWTSTQQIKSNSITAMSAPVPGSGGGGGTVTLLNVQTP